MITTTLALLSTLLLLQAPAMPGTAMAERVSALANGRRGI